MPWCIAIRIFLNLTIQILKNQSSIIAKPQLFRRWFRFGLRCLDWSV